MSQNNRGMLIAASVAALLASGSVFAGDMSAPSGSPMVHCAGINACKGQGACQSKSNACKGMNACKGKGWLPTSTKAECKAQGGKPVRIKMKKPASQPAA